MKLWNWRDLFTDHHSGKLRETMIWSNIGKATITGAFVFETVHGSLTEWLVMAYGGLVILHETTARFMNQRQQGLDKSKEEPK